MATLLLLAGAASAQTTIRLLLNVVNTALPHQYYQVGTSQSTYLSQFRGVPTDLTEKILRTASTVRGQATYESFLRGDIDQTTWEKTKREISPDTLNLSRKPLRHQINTLVGTKRQRADCFTKRKQRLVFTAECRAGSGSFS